MAVIPCPSPPTPIVRGIVTFDPAAFVVLYPAFTAIPAGQLDQAFLLAQLILNNTCSSRVQNANERDTLLQLLVAHITFLMAGSNDGAGNITPAPGITGRINTATEGSVSVGAEFGGNGGPTQDWYTSTQWGSMYWLATSKYRTALYIPAPLCGPNGPAGPYGYGGTWGGFGGGGCGC